MNSLIRPPDAYITQKHQTNFKSAVTSIQREVDHARSQGQNDNYGHVAVMSFLWKNDDIGVAPLEAELMWTFRHVYGYHTETYTIDPSSGPPHLLQTRVSKAIQAFTQVHDNFNELRTLLIYVYSGHAETTPTNYGCKWYGYQTPRKQAPAPRLDFLNELRPIATSVFSDVLFVFDCCFGATASMENMTYEYLVSSLMESPSTLNIQESFTRRLIDILRRYNGAPINIAQIHSLLMSSAHTSGACLDSTPVYIPSMSRSATLIQSLIPTSPKANQQVFKDLSGQRGKVLITLSLTGQDAIPDVAQFKDHLLSKIPSNVSDIELQAVFGGQPLVVLMTVPVEVWDRLPNDGSYRFVAHVNTRNVLPVPTFSAVP